MAVACRTTKENRWVIASENPHFDSVEYAEWLAEHEVGYFIRDEGDPFDCQYMSQLVFDQIYIFENSNESAMFREIKRV